MKKLELLLKIIKKISEKDRIGKRTGKGIEF